MNKINLIGRVFGEYTVSGTLKINGRTHALATCSCGNMKTVRLSHLTQGKILSCGCHKARMTSTVKSKETHIGDRFGMMVVIKELPRVRNHNGASQRFFELLCDCGNIKRSTLNHFRAGKAVSCGCYNVIINTLKSTTHGMSGTPTYKAWSEMLKRIKPYNKRSDRYHGRGITVCDRWLVFENFFSDMGVKPDGTSLDRIDNDLGYCKENCRWASSLTQANNKGNNVLLKYKGKSYTLADASRVFGIPYPRLQYRIAKGWGAAKAIETPRLKN